jgi:hypothetical protein
LILVAVETIFVHKVCKSQPVKVEKRPLFCEMCNHTVRTNEVIEVDNTPSPFTD